jgi:hypothetical protein
MAHSLKNRKLLSAAYAPVLPTGSSTLGPDSPVTGQIRFSSTSANVEYYNNSKWNQVAHQGNVTIVKDSFTTTSSPTYYGPMSYSYISGQETSVLMFIGGVHQIPGTNYTFAGNNYVYINSSTGGNNQPITILHNFNSTIAN